MPASSTAPSLRVLLSPLGRFRANLYRQQAGLDGVFRLVPPQPPTLEELSLPDDLAKLTEHMNERVADGTMVTVRLLS